MPGFWELIVLLIILVIVFGARRLPALGEAIGRSIANYKKNKTQQSDMIEVSHDDHDPEHGKSDPRT